jgi:hypothetical protein
MIKKKHKSLKKMVLTTAAVAVMTSLSAAPALAKDNVQQNIDSLQWGMEAVKGFENMPPA